jgi:hypothetical protein
MDKFVAFQTKIKEADKPIRGHAEEIRRETTVQDWKWQV